MSNELALQRSLSDVVDEYNQKMIVLDEEIAKFEAAGNAIRMASIIGGTFGGTSIDVGHVHKRQLERSLAQSAWLHVYNVLNLDRIAPAADKKRFKQAVESPPPFTLNNIRATFGDYILNPRGNILRGLAEVFCDLDPFYKSHDKVKIGVKALPKRIILSNVSDYGWGRDRLADVINALASYQNKPLAGYVEISKLLKNGNALLNEWEAQDSLDKDKIHKFPARGIRLVRYKNGNAHLFFEPQELRNINKALSEYYGEVLPDTSEEKPEKKQESRAVSKDLQYYPTPAAVVERVLDNMYRLEGKQVLEPSCGCGRFLDALRARGANVYGIEYDASRASQSRSKGHPVLCANFLETVPEPKYDYVVMNPPFYGTHYAKHVKHALKFLKPDGLLYAILPATARYDHGLLKGRWDDLPVGSFSESGTNINTTVLTCFPGEAVCF